jgi:mannose-P-dolichol utilization defect protein 1
MRVLLCCLLVWLGAAFAEGFKHIHGLGCQLHHTCKRRMPRTIESFKRVTVPPTPALQLTAGSGTTAEVLTPNLKSLDRAAVLIGYALAASSLLLYTPILAKLLSSRSPSGMSMSTWALNVFGTLLALSYPIKQGYPVSTYADLAIILVQAVAVLGLLCFYQNALAQFFCGAAACAALFGTFIRSDQVSSSLVQSSQVASIAVCTAAAVPQILLTYQTKKAAWSWITALLSTVGCTARIFTTLRLTKDRTALMGYVLGAVMNGILLGQVLWYGQPS